MELALTKKGFLVSVLMGELVEEKSLQHGAECRYMGFPKSSIVSYTGKILWHLIKP